MFASILSEEGLVTETLGNKVCLLNHSIIMINGKNILSINNS